MHVTTDQVLAVVVVLNFIASLFAHFHAKKAATVIQSVASDLQNNAPAVAEAATEVEKVATGLVQDLSK